MASSSPFTPAFDQLAQEQLEKWKLPGASLSVIKDNETWTGCYGFLDLENKKAVKEDSLFFGGSTTKAFSCAAWGIYIASKENEIREKRIGWNTKLKDLLEGDWAVQGGEEVTLEDVLSHRSGMPRHELSYGWGKNTNPREITRNLRSLGADAMHSPVREEWEYCNTGYVAATHALEVVTGKNLTDVLRGWIWEPLGMKDTFGGWEEVREKGEEVVGRMQQGYSCEKVPGEEGWEDAGFRLEKRMELGLVSGAGYIVSTPSDYAKWMRCLITSSAPLSTEITKELFKPRAIIYPDQRLPHVPYDNDLHLYALGWQIASWNGKKVFSHGGGLIGGGALVVIIPEAGIGGMFLSNCTDSGARFQVPLFHLLGTTLGIPQDELKTSLKGIEDRIPKFYADIIDPGESFRKIYTDAPSSPKIPLALPVSSYAGTFKHAGYGPITLTTDRPDGVEGESGDIWWDIKDRTWESVWAIRHVNAEYWLAVAVQGGFKQMRRVESKVGQDGKVKSFGVAMEPSMPETLFWFERIRD